MNVWIVAGAIVFGALVIASAIALRPSPFGECVTVISADIYHRDLSVTLDPRDVEAQAARICSGIAA